MSALIYFDPAPTPSQRAWIQQRIVDAFVRAIGTLERQHGATLTERERNGLLWLRHRMVKGEVSDS